MSIIRLIIRRRLGAQSGTWRLILAGVD
ncbi:hypothetical protein CCACVL1_02873 [Corchorus capsularis]|uniref:Uncharacterized protein n=1 Tax=Corchorus capsularis TaxID=210143 RepID=A0A1R3K536_COCAP|nr:hypothetical protein CCACVL1_02873 [Corchorus capsularis]